MIENQSDNIDIKENDVSNQDNAPEDTSSAEDKIIENDELSSSKTEEINTEELKNTISNNCLLYTSPSPRDEKVSRMPSAA